jgi:hypothetical protein
LLRFARFVKRDHGDGISFDGRAGYTDGDFRGGILAHGFYPKKGMLHFDDDEMWGDGPSKDGKSAFIE